VNPEVAIILHKTKVARLREHEDEEYSMDAPTAALLSGVTTKDWLAKQVTDIEKRERMAV
jgi:hypothetical protein